MKASQVWSLDLTLVCWFHCTGTTEATQNCGPLVSTNLLMGKAIINSCCSYCIPCDHLYV